MIEENRFWRNKDLREHVAVLDETIQPTLILKDGRYLNVYTKKWTNAHIWIYKDRIIYVGKNLPKDTTDVEMVDCVGQYIVPGYIEPHAHPFLLYNPEELAHHAAHYGTTTLINDNLTLINLKDKKKALSLLDYFEALPVSMFWWGRYDAQTSLHVEGDQIEKEDLLKWLSHPSIVLGGELTSSAHLLDGDDRLLYWIQETKKLKKPIEGNLINASEEMLMKMKLLGVTSDHEAKTGQQAYERIEQGYHVTLRESSLYPHMAEILSELEKTGLDYFDNISFTTDASAPHTLKGGLINQCIQIAIDQGIPPIEAYRMGSYNTAKHYGLDDVFGSIAPGKIAHLNILYDAHDPTPLSVIAKGEWIVRDGVLNQFKEQMNWPMFAMEPITYDWDVTADDLQFSIPIGLEVVDDITLKAYPVPTDITADLLPEDSNDAFLLVINRQGSWRVNTVIRNFTSVGGLATSISTNGNVVIIGKNKQDMLRAWKRMKAIGGGIVLSHAGEIIYELNLQLNGTMFVGGMEQLIEKEAKLNELLKSFGYQKEHPIFNLIFLSATHLPYVRITEQGIYDVLKRKTIVPANMR